MLPDRALYHGPDEVARDLCPATERHRVALGELTKQYTLEVAQVRIVGCSRVKVTFKH